MMTFLSLGNRLLTSFGLAVSHPLYHCPPDNSLSAFSVYGLHELASNPQVTPAYTEPDQLLGVVLDKDRWTPLPMQFALNLQTEHLQ